MIQTIRVYTSEEDDSKGRELLKELKAHHTVTKLNKIQTATVFRIEGISKKEAEKLTAILFSESINQNFTINSSLFNDAHYKTEIAYKPGVMNPVVGSIIKSAHDLKIKPKAVDVSILYAFYTKEKTFNVAKHIQSWGLFNPTIEMQRFKSPKTLQIKGRTEKTDIIPIRSYSDSQLIDLSKNTLFLTLPEMQAIKTYFQKIKRDPTDCELEILAQTWSEHCVHKTFKADLIIDGKKKSPLFKRIKSTAEHNRETIVSAFVDNSGVIDFYDGFAICGKVETHNSPSAIEPYGGAMTGSGGVFRDILGTGKGAKPIVSTDIFCLARPDLPASDVPPGCLKPSYILTKVVEGVRDYGNRVGIPTNNGSFHFHNGFRAKPTVAVGSFGILPKKFAKKQTPKQGDIILTIGGKTGRDGIHGATFSSAEMTNETKTISGSAVQIGNAIEEKRVIDAVLALRDKNLIRAITDCGAGGYSSAIGEMGEKTGARVHLEKVPLKYKGLKPWEIFLSESQERMVLSIDPAHLQDVLAHFKEYNVEATNIGEFTGVKSLEVFYKTERVCNLSMDFLHNGLPKTTLVGKTKQNTVPIQKTKFKKNDLKKLWMKVLSHPTVSSKEPILRQYDHNVQGTNALHPFGGVHYDGPNDGSVIKPLLNKPYAFIATHGLNPSLMEHDVYHGSVWAITEAVSNYVSVGGDTGDAALIDNFIWPFPDEESLADLDSAVDACVDMAATLAMPFVSGKDSLSSTYRFPDNTLLKIPPVLLVSVFGKIPDVTKTVSSDFKRSGSTIVLVGKADIENMRGTIASEVSNVNHGTIPKTDIQSLPKVFETITLNIRKGNILSCHDISEGGMITTLSEMCFGGDIGAEINVEELNPQSDEHALFHETAGTFLVEVESSAVAKKIFKGIPYTILGKTQSRETITIKHGKNLVVSSHLDTLKHVWKKPMEELFS